MSVILDSKDLALLDKRQIAKSTVWEVLKYYGTNQEITEADFAGVNEVRVNKMSGIGPSTAYVRNGDNVRSKVDVEKETRKLKQERWQAFDLDILDESENAGYTIENIILEQTRLTAIPEKDTAAMNEIYIAGKSGGVVSDVTITADNVLEEYDKIEAHFGAKGLEFNGVLFMTSETYGFLKNAKGVSRGLRLDEPTRVQGLDRTIRMMDGHIPIQVVSDDRMVNADTGTNPLQFIFVGSSVSNCIEKYNDVTLVPAEHDRNGNRDTVKFTNYYDNIILDNKKELIYISRKA